MAAETFEPLLAEARNGQVTPLYFDRQVVRADDLTLDRSSHDAELARMRRLLHGWGVVVGLVPELGDDALNVSPGFAVTPTGAEVLLTVDISVEAIAAAVVACCGTADGGCEVVDPEALEEVTDGGPVTAWLVARPTREDAEPRAGIPAGCAHPANALLPSRCCAGVRLGLLCELPPSHTDPGPSPDELLGLVCGPHAPGAPALALPMPEIPGPESDFVVLGRLVVQDGVTVLSQDDRRRLLPAEVLQAWVVSQTCPAP